MKRAACCRPRKMQPSTSTINQAALLLVNIDQAVFSTGRRRKTSVYAKTTSKTQSLFFFKLKNTSFLFGQRQRHCTLPASRRSILLTSVDIHFIILFITSKIYRYIRLYKCTNFYWIFVKKIKFLPLNISMHFVYFKY